MADFVVVGAGISGLAFARVAAEKGHKVLVVEKRSYPGGLLHCRDHNGIEVHEHGPHIFHTSDELAWSFFKQFASLDGFVNSPIANADGKICSLPFSMYTFNQMWGVVSPDEAKKIIESQKLKLDREPENLEEKALSLVGKDIYETLIKGYTEKQWGRKCSELPPWIIGRLPVRLTYNAKYFNDRHQGLPEAGWNAFIDRIVEHPNIEILYGVDYLEHRNEFKAKRKTICTAPIDQWYGFEDGVLQWRSIRFEEEMDGHVESIQGAPVVNWPTKSVAWTRSSEWKHFKESSANAAESIITKEYPVEWAQGMDPLYPIPTKENNEMYGRYVVRAIKDADTLFLGRQGRYRYLNIDTAIHEAVKLAKEVA